MRLIMLALLLLLALTFANAVILRRQLQMAAAENYVGTSGLAQPAPRHNEWGGFAFREFGAFVIVVFVYGGMATLRKRR